MSVDTGGTFRWQSVGVKHGVTQVCELGHPNVEATVLEQATTMNVTRRGSPDWNFTKR